MLWVYVSLFFKIWLTESILISRVKLFRGNCFLLASNTLRHKFFSNVNKQSSLEWRCINLKGEIMAESCRWVSNIKISILLKKVDSLMSEYPWNKENNTFTWLSSFYNPFNDIMKLNFCPPSPTEGWQRKKRIEKVNILRMKGLLKWNKKHYSYFLKVFSLTK